MKYKFLSFLLVCLLCISSSAFVALAVDNPEELPTDIATSDAPAAQEPSAQEPDDWEDGVVPMPIDVPEPMAEPTEQPTATPEPTEQPTATPEPAALDVEIKGNGTIEAYVNGGWERVQTGTDALEIPSGAINFRAIAAGQNTLARVTLDNREVDFEADSSLTGVWEFTLNRATDGGTLVAEFSDRLSVDVSVEGPGTISRYENNRWTQVSPGTDAVSVGVGERLVLCASASQDGYAPTSIKLNDTEIPPTGFTAEGAVFEFQPPNGDCEVSVEFTKSDQLIVDLEGQGTLFLVKGTNQIELQDEARLPFDAQDAPMTFTLTPATGYAMGTVTFQSGSLTVTKVTSTQASTLDSYTCTLVSPVNGGVLKATFLASDDSAIQWVRGTDPTTGISWAAPLGTSVYGTSNVTTNSRVLITRLTQGSSYDAARTAATPYSQFAVWDISMVDQNGQTFTPTVPVLMNLPIPSGYPTTVPPLRMLHILSSNGRVVENTIETRTNPQTGTPYLFMRADSLSTFVLVNTNSPVATATPTTTTTSGGTTGTTATATPAPTPTTAPLTGDPTNLALWWTVLVLCVAMIGVSGFELGRISPR